MYLIYRIIGCLMLKDETQSCSKFRAFFLFQFYSNLLCLYGNEHHTTAKKKAYFTQSFIIVIISITIA